jgi:DNA-binding MarR family transcriptional regulator
VLLEVERAGPVGLRPYELERAMLLAQYNLSRLIDRIEAAGYVERKLCTDDGRGQRVVMTDAGKVIRRQMWPVYARAIECAVGDRLSAEEAEVLGDLLGRLIGGQDDVTIPKTASNTVRALEIQTACSSASPGGRRTASGTDCLRQCQTIRISNTS